RRGGHLDHAVHRSKDGEPRPGAGLHDVPGTAEAVPAGVAESPQRQRGVDRPAITRLRRERETPLGADLLQDQRPDLSGPGTDRIAVADFASFEAQFEG